MNRSIGLYRAVKIASKSGCPEDNHFSKYSCPHRIFGCPHTKKECPLSDKLVPCLCLPLEWWRLVADKPDVVIKSYHVLIGQ